MSNPSLLRSLGLCLLACALSTTATHAQFSVLYTYGSHAGDPVDPQSNTSIAQGRDGNLYSTAIQGGANNGGAAFMMTPSGALTVLYSFCSQPSCADGTRPYGGLTLGTDGNFYGTTSGGGNGDNAYGDGVVFKMTSAGAFTVLHVIDNPNKSEGYFPYAAPVEGLDGNFYGTTSGGGSARCGTLYKVTPTGTFTILHTFNASTDGCGPQGSLVLGTDGNLYGMANNGAYITFKITPSGKYTNLTSSSVIAGGNAPLMQAPNGSFYGSNGGQIFKMSPSGAISILHTSSGTTDPNGYGYNSGVVWASDGNLYGDSTTGGTTTDCSSNLGYCGVIFKMTTGGAYTDLFDFENPDGYEGTPVLQHTNGIIYGQTDFGGTIPPNAGTFWSWNTSLKPFVSFMPFTGHVGDQIQIFGQGFTSSSVVKFNGVVASYTLTGSTFITATVPTGTLDGYITVTTGGTTLKSLYKFMVHDSWGAGAAMPTAAVVPCVAVLSGKVYVVGGFNGSPLTNNQIYNPTTNTWSAGTSLGTGLSNQACAGVNGEVYEFGGTNNDGGSETNAVWAYNPSTKVWTSKTAMPTSRDDSVAVVDKGLVYVIGGYNNGNRLTTVETYNPAADTWTSEASLLVAQSGDAGGLIGTSIVISDGAGQSSDTGDTESYSVTKNSWTSLTADSTVRNNPCGGAIGTSLYVAGGANRTGPALNVVEAFAPASNTWKPLSSIPQATVGPGSAVLNGQLYCFGGWTGFQGTVLNNLQIYQP